MEMKKGRKPEKMTGGLMKPGIWCCAGAGALFVSFCSQWGSQLDNIGNVDVRAVSTWLIPLVMGCILTPVLAAIFAWAGTGAGNRSRGRNQIQEKWESIRIVGWWRKQSFSTQLLLRAVALFACWFPVFLAVYPGFFAYDAAAELDEVVTGGYVTRHPLLHVLLLGKTVAKFHELTGSYNTGIVVYVVTQMTVMALLFSWVLEKLKKFGSGTVIGIISFLFLGFFPVIPMYALCTSKDTPYTAGMLAVLIILTDLCRGKKAFWSSPGKVLGLGAALLVMAVFRSNGVGVFLLMVPVLLWLAGKGFRRRMAAVAAVVLAAYFGLQAGLNAALHPENTDAMEGFTVPIQQLARAWNYNPEIFSEQDKTELFEIFREDAMEMYNPKLSDLVKSRFSTKVFAQDPEKYASLWARIGMRAPATYLNAWLMTSYGFWYPNTVIDVYNGNLNYSESSYFSCETEAPGERHSYFPWLERQYEKISWEKEIHETPVISWLFSPGALCWVWILGGLCLIAVGKKREAAALLPVYFNFLTVLIGPTYLVRYVLIFWFGLPVLLSILSGLWYTSKETPGYCSNQS